MPRFYGMVQTYFQRQRHGFIEEIGEVGSLSKDNVVTDRNVYFRTSDFQVADSLVFRKATSGDIVEYSRKTDDRGRHRAYDITGLSGKPLPCELGITSFKRYIDIHRATLQHETRNLVNRTITESQSTGRYTMPEPGFGNVMNNADYNNVYTSYRGFSDAEHNEDVGEVDDGDTNFFGNCHDPHQSSGVDVEDYVAECVVDMCGDQETYEEDVLCEHANDGHQSVECGNSQNIEE